MSKYLLKLYDSFIIKENVVNGKKTVEDINEDNSKISDHDVVNSTLSTSEHRFIIPIKKYKELVAQGGDALALYLNAVHEDIEYRCKHRILGKENSLGYKYIS